MLLPRQNFTLEIHLFTGSHYCACKSISKLHFIFLANLGNLKQTDRSSLYKARLYFAAPTELRLNGRAAL